MHALNIKRKRTNSAAHCTTTTQRRVAKHVFTEHSIRVNDDARVVRMHPSIQQRHQVICNSQKASRFSCISSKTKMQEVT